MRPAVRPRRFLAGLIAIAAAALAAAQAPAPVGAPAAPAPALPVPVPVPVPPAPASHDADPALWVVKDRDTTIYLFGTVHVLKPGLSWFDEAVKKAFDSSDQLVLELVTPDPAAMQALVRKIGFTSGGPTLTERLPAEDRPLFARTLADLGIPATAFDRVKPWVAAINLTLLPVLRLGYDPANGPEGVLTASAGAEHKPVIGLETAEQQLGYFDSLPEPVQIRFLVQTLKDLPRTQAMIDKMVASWSDGDPQALAETMNEEMSDSPELAKVLLNDRNIRWADWIRTRMKQPGTVFVAVGAGHLAGPDSVQAQLARRHLKAVRIAY